MLRRPSLSALFLLLLSATLRAQTTHPTPSSPPPLPIPNPALQNQSRDMIHNLFSKDYAKKSPTDRQSLAKLLLAQAKDTRDDPVARYVALTESLDLASGSGDAITAFAAIDQLSHFYTIDLLDLQRQTLTRAHQNAQFPEQSESIMQLSLATADQAVIIDAFDAVAQLTDLAEAAANKTRQVKIVASIQIHLANLRAILLEFSRVKAAFATLDHSPSDAAAADAHLTIGRFYTLYKNQWPLGLPHLAQSSDPTLKSLAQKELVHAPTAPDTDPLALADAWWIYAQSAEGLPRTNATAHAQEWYKLAQAAIQGITLARIQSRLSTTPDEKTIAAAPSPNNILNILQLIDPAKDTAQGNWSLANHALSCENSSYATLQLPINTPDEFDLTLHFTRTEGNGPIAILLSSHGHAFDFALDIKNEARFERVDAKIAKDNPTSVPVTLANNQPHTLQIQLRKDSIAAIFDAQPLTQWKTDYKDLSRYSVWKITDTALPGIGVNNAKVTFDAITLSEITGKAKPLRP